MPLMLHLAFGLGEDWNYQDEYWYSIITPLHLAFGLGEDWNVNFAAIVIFGYDVAPSLRAG